jgi:hypothetical protein
VRQATGQAADRLHFLGLADQIFELPLAGDEHHTGDVSGQSFYGRGVVVDGDYGAGFWKSARCD